MAQEREGVIGRHAIEPAPNIRLRRARDKRRLALASRLPGIVEGLLHEVERLLWLTDEASQIDMQSMLMGIYQAGKIILGDDAVRLRPLAHEKVLARRQYESRTCSMAIARNRGKSVR